jgi:cytochrome o ubiquinol oxidase subunit 3
MSLSIEARRVRATYIGAALTFALGAVFLALEFSEFAGMALAGDGPARSAFLSAFFTLVGTHGAHVTCGLIWLTVMMAQVATLGFRDKVVRRLRCFALFWHALDIVWVALFTVVYLIGAR